MVDPKAALITAAMALYAAPALAQDGVCDRCGPEQGGLWAGEAEYQPSASYPPQVRYEQRAHAERSWYGERSEAVTRVSYAQGYLTWPGKDASPQYGPGPYGPGGPPCPPCPPVRPGERVVSCRYVPFAQPYPEAEEAPIASGLDLDGGVGPDYFAEGGGGGGGATIIEGGGSSFNGAYASASASANVSASIVINERENQHPRPKGGGGWGGGSMGGGSWGQGSMGGGESWSGGPMASNGRYGSWPSGGAMGSGGVGHGGGAHAVRGVARGHGKK